MISPYCTLAEANTYLALDLDNWIALTDDEKNDALYWGRIYIDSIYTCLDDNGDQYDDTTAPDELKYANALAANAHSQGAIYESEKDVAEISVTAGTVSSTKRYAVPAVSTVEVAEVNQIKALLKDICSGSYGNLSRV